MERKDIRYLVDLCKSQFGDFGSDFLNLRQACKVCYSQKSCHGIGEDGFNKSVIRSWLQGMGLHGIEICTNEQIKLLVSWYGRTYEYWEKVIDKRPLEFFDKLADIFWDYGAKTYSVNPNEQFQGFTQSVFVLGINWYSQNKTEQDAIKDGFKIVTPFECDEMYDDYIKSICNDWIEITEEEYENQLNVLPPVKWYDGGFFISEATTSYVHAFYQKLNGKFYTSLQDIFESRDVILDNLNNAIKNGKIRKVA